MTAYDDLDREQKQFDERLERDGGVFVEPNGVREVGGEAEGSPPADYVEDAWSGDDRPGTVDDLPYTMGVQVPDADDQHLVPEGGTHQHGRPAPDTEKERDLGRPDERELWSAQKPLIEEDEGDGLKLEGFADESIPKILAAMGDDAADPLHDNPDGVSATGAGGEPDHGGFPERE